MGSGSNIVGAFSSDTTLPTPVPINKGGTGQITAQAAIDALTNVSAASANEVLTKDGSGNATFQAAGGGGQVELVEHKVVSSSPSITITISPAINQSDISHLIIIWNGKTSTSNGINFTLNGISTSTWIHRGNYVSGASEIVINSAGQTSVRMAFADIGINTYSICTAVCNDNDDTLEGTMLATGETGGQFQGFQNSTACQTSFSEVKVENKDTGVNLGAGSTLTVFKVLSS